MPNDNYIKIRPEERPIRSKVAEKVKSRKGKSQMIDTEWLNAAIATIQAGIADKLTKGNITVYRVLNIIRIDINLGAAK